MSDKPPVFGPLAEWQRVTGKNDAQTAALIGVTASVFSRFRNGLQTLKMKDQLRLEHVTGITPAQCAEFYASVVKAGASGRRPEKKSPAAAREAA